jgi:ribosomal protein S18 acetylase RimI-like enzyme
MLILELEGADVASAAALWTETGLTRQWNDPEADFHRALSGLTSSVLGLKHDNVLVGSVMVGHDGHRGWMYYLAVPRDHQGKGIGSELIRTAEVWLRAMGAVKVQLMVRSHNDSLSSFYENAGYEVNDVQVLSRWL